MRVLFRQPPSEPGLQFSLHPALQCLFPRVLPCRVSGVDVLVAAAADDEGFAAAFRHLPHPFGLVGPIPGLEVFQAPDVVRFDVCP